MADTPALASEKYIRLTTYTKDGRPKYTPVWIVGLDGGQLGFHTEAASWKVKRLRNDPRVAVQPSNSRGAVKEGTAELTGTAEIVSGPELERVDAALKEKYGWQWSMIGVVDFFKHTFKRAGDEGAVGIVLTLTGPGDADTEAAADEGG